MLSPPSGTKSSTEFYYQNPHAGGRNQEATNYWLVHGTPEEVYDILLDLAGYARWWSAVYRDVSVVNDNGESVYEMKTRGWLPHTYQLKTKEKIPSRRIEQEVQGDLVGRSIWTIEGDLENPWSHITHKWLVRGNNAVLKALFWIAKSRHMAIYKRAMKKGEESLQAELNRRSTEHRTLPDPLNER